MNHTGSSENVAELVLTPTQKTATFMYDLTTLKTIMPCRLNSLLLCTLATCRELQFVSILPNVVVGCT